QAKPDARDVGVVADTAVCDRYPREAHVVDRQMVLAVGERFEPAPRVAREPSDELAIGLRQRRAVDERARRPAGEARPHVGPCRLLAAERGLPRLLPDGNDDVPRARLHHTADDALAELAGVVSRNREEPA